MGGRGSSSGNTSRLPALQGSEKQVKWATDLRNNVIKVIEAERKAFKEYKSYLNGIYDDEYLKSWNKNTKEAMKITKASAWIDGFRNFNEYNTKSAIDSLKEIKKLKAVELNDNNEKEWSNYISERNKIRSRLSSASTAYETFVKRNK